MSDSLFVMLGAFIQRALPLLIGIYVSRVFGEEYFSEISYLFISINMMVAFISGGFVPSILSSISNRSLSQFDKESKVSSYYISVIFAWLVVSSVFLSYFSLHENANTILIILVAALSLSLITVSASMLNSINEYFCALKISILFACGIILSVYVSSVLNYDFEGFLWLFFTCYIWASIVSLIIVNNKIDIAKNIKLKYVFGAIKSIYREITGLLVVNVLWMAGVFILHSLIKNSSHDDSFLYPVFALGYQWYTLLIFIPGVLASVVIPKMTKSQSPKNICFKMMMLYAAVGVILAFIITYDGLLVLYVYGFEYPNDYYDIFVWMVFAGVLSAVNSPMIQYLVSKKRICILIIMSLVWFSLNMSLYYVLNGIDFERVFFASNVFVFMFMLYFIVREKDIVSSEISRSA